MWQQIDRNYGLRKGWLITTGFGGEMYMIRWSSR
jgi:hypothetical protein